ncbi:heavy metal-associated isoprenylated plant protein 3 isoform X2 [Phoenix dactylifera]|uniref:Heavy metal-associated isoprenylated plant protein 3 isoform X2 n=1 Tax=Phoenix dactylifera TaxID=42345 RepID=A0A8B7MTW9_PHODC|nr:heavy metal-associated isoprenylated plant protein 3 isoform X2 [Phoenix dactylifera]
MGNEKKEGGEGGKKDGGTIAVVLKVDMHCEGCAEKVKKSVKGFEGVEGVKADIGGGKLTVVGKVDPSKLRDRVAAKTHKKVDIVSPINPPKKDAKEKDISKKPAAEKVSKKSDDKKKSQEPVVSTVVLKTHLHCDGCVDRITKKIRKLKGVQQVTADAQKDLVTVKGTMDAKALPEVLKQKLKQAVEVASPKKDDDGKKKDKGGDKKDKGGEKETASGGGGGGGGGGKDDGGKAEANRMDYYYTAGYPYGIEMGHAPQLFSDENPNGCSVM